MTVPVPTTPQALTHSEPVGWGWRAALLAVWFVTLFGSMACARELQSWRFLGWPLSYWLAAQGLIVVFVAIVAFYAWLANRREREQAQASVDDGGVAYPDAATGRDGAATNGSAQTAAASHSGTGATVIATATATATARDRPASVARARN